MTGPEGDEPDAGGQSLAAGLGIDPAATKPGTPITPGGPAGTTRAAHVMANAGVTAATAAAGSGASSAASGGKRTIAQRAIDRVPLKWLSTASLAVFLGVTALFGGLEAVAAPEAPVIAAGETYVGSEIEMTPIQLTVIDKLDAAGVYSDGGDRIVTLIMDVRNASEFARTSTATESLTAIRIDGLEEALRDAGLADDEIPSKVAPSVARLDDGTIGPWLQPGIAVRVALSWVVPPALIHDGDTVRLGLPTATRSIGQSVIYGIYWSDQHVGGYADLAIDDRGSGSE